MVKVALYVRLEAKPGKEAEVEKFLKDGLALVQQEPATSAWFGIRDGTFDVRNFRCFPRRGGAPSSSQWESGRSADGESLFRFGRS
jgi:hypothetical protein